MVVVAEMAAAASVAEFADVAEGDGLKSLNQDSPSPESYKREWLTARHLL